MKNEVIFDQYDYFEGFFFGTLNGRKNFFYISVENEEHAKKILNQYKHYDEAHLLVPGLKGFDNWHFGNETKLVSPLKWEICEEKLHVSKDSIKGKISAKTNFTLEFSNIKNKKRKMKNYSVEIIFDTNIYENEDNNEHLFNRTGFDIFITGDSRTGYGKNEENNKHVYSPGLEYAKLDVESGKVHIHPYVNKKESFYTYDFGGFISNQKVVDEIYDMFVHVCNLLAKDSKENYKNLKLKLNALKLGA